jgi:cytochrome P450
VGLTLQDRAPSLDLDLFADDVLEDSRNAFAQVRDAGPVVWLPRHRLWAMGRFNDVRAALRNDEVFISGDGVAANPISNRLGRKTTLSSDGETHTARRKVLIRSLSAKALAAIEPRIEAEAEEIVAALCDGREFEASRDFASRLPVRVVADLVGIDAHSDQMLRWAASTFDVLGPLNRRGRRASSTSLGLLAYSRRISPSKVSDNGWASKVFEAAGEGEITTAEARAMVIDLVAPSLDTTILASTHLLWDLARNPDAFDRVREDPDLVSTAVVETVRLASPIRGFTRRVATDTQIGGTTVREGSRVAVLFGAANLDERQFAAPERYDLDREQPAHLGWGNGPHTCVGIHLAKLEMRALLRAMASRVRRVRVGAPKRLRNNTLQGIAELPARFET